MFVDANDISTQLDALGRLVRWEVIDLVSGMNIQNAICCDDVNGVLTRFVCDQNGNVLLNAHRESARRVTESGQYKLVASAS